MQSSALLKQRDNGTFVKFNIFIVNNYVTTSLLNTETAHFSIERIKVRLVGSDNLLMKAIKLKQFLQPKFESENYNLSLLSGLVQPINVTRYIYGQKLCKRRIYEANQIQFDKRVKTQIIYNNANSLEITQTSSITSVLLMYNH
ncbi:Hypothetical_protein [Hexamita inflata]|uniref:Hypothetical_protein n=1 Tax=Hexamita inflata TaxID=28002 RepID=A0AA86NCL7_9EUKA|nr:Hypothetical protein HINF_LOCUS4869 [Hexamita inflata]